ncbi:MAG: squalene/phytoene synthase family protein [bacterium]
MTIQSTEALHEAYRQCIEVTRRAARNFYYGIRLLKRERFASLCALYAFCRELDDVVDHTDGQESPQLFTLRRRLLNNESPEDADKIAVAFRDTMDKYQLPSDVLCELIDTIESDLGRRHFETMDEVVRYAHGVASTVGLCSVRIFGVPAGDADDFAETLGIALQWTNILRDIEEDNHRRRCYLPQESLRKFGLTIDDLLANPQDEKVRLWWKTAIEQGREFFRAAGKAFPSRYRRELRPALAMAAVYRQMLEEMSRQPNRRPNIHPVRKLLAVFTTLIGLWNPLQ